MTVGGPVLRRFRLGLALAVALTTLLVPRPAAGATLLATYQAQPPAAAVAGTTIQVPVSVTNAGSEVWNAAGPNPVDLAYHWSDAAGTAVVWDGVRTKLPADVAPASAQQLVAAIVMPPSPGTYILQLALVKEGIAWLNPSQPFGVRATPAYNATYGAPALPPLLLNATTYTVTVPVTNTGGVAWTSAGANPVDLSYHWHDASGGTVVWDGIRNPLPADIAAGASASVTAQVRTPDAAGTYVLTFDLVREGIAWFGAQGAVPLRLSATVATATYAAGYSISASSNAVLGEQRTLAVTVTNSGNVPWPAAGPNPIHLSYHLFDRAGNVVVWDGARTGIGTDLLPGASRSINVAYTAPTSIGTYTLAIDTVREGVAWLSGLGSPYARTSLVVTSGFNGGYDQTTTPGTATIGATLLLSVRVSNYGARAWPAGGPNPVQLSYHILTPGGQVVTWDGRRGALPADVAVGQTAVVQVPVQLPSAIGDYRISWDLVQEGIAWFSQLGVGRLSEAISVQPGVTFYGKGFGHGVGMSQYGAEGYATGAAGPALTGEQIVAHYYPGTQLTVVDAATNARGPMRVLLSAPSSSGSSSCGSQYLNTWLINVRSPGGFTVANEREGNAIVGIASPNVTYQIAATAGGVAVYDQGTNPPTLKYKGPGPVTLSPIDTGQPITVQEKGEFFRGKLQFKNDGAGNLRVVNFVSYDDYVRGVIPKEMPLGWHPEAYKAQALAARSYGFTSAAPARDYDVRDDQSDQCYGGATVETTAGNAAVAATLGKVITYNGAAIRAYFSSSSGGYTVGVGCWNNGITCKPSDPWLVPVPDPADLAVRIPTPNKHASWTVTFTSAQIRQAVQSYRGVDIGTLLSTDVSNQAPGNVGHVVSVKFAGSNATVEVPADLFLRTYLGLKSTMVRLSPF
ncbi:MAG TPA: SpoIID/LytB domain-containing protein [Candidatus Limnocylindria bacterium]|nr:SpoIID/LytB domain-containing protein [Candidatus Limnocylindria bacterium]